MKSNGTQVLIEACDVAVESVSSEADLIWIESNIPIESSWRSVAKSPLFFHLLFQEMPSCQVDDLPGASVEE